MNDQYAQFDSQEFHWMTVLLQNIDVGIIVLNKDYRIQIWNTFMENHSGMQPQEVRDKNLFELFPEIPKQWFRRKCEAVFQLKHHSYNTWQERPFLIEFKNYRPITYAETDMYQNFTVFPISSLTGETEFIAIVIYDVTDVALGKKELINTNRALTAQSRTDQLTQLCNRWYWELRLEQEFARFQRYGTNASLILFDIDHFKHVNDAYGHLAGDEVIRTVSQRLVNLKRTTDIAGRYGGEEFGIILVDTSQENAQIFAERLRQEIESNSIQHKDISISVTISLGLRGFSNETGSYEKILAQADEALYRSKSDGRNRTTLYEPTGIAEVNKAVNQ